MLNSLHSFIKGFAAKVLLTLLVLSFAVWGIGDFAGGSANTEEVVKVGDSSILLGEYRRNLDQEKEKMQRALGGNYSPQLLAQLQVPQQVLQQMVNRLLLLEEARDIGLMPSDAIILENIQKNSAFHDEQGYFNKDMFRQRLRSVGLNEKGYIEQLRQQIAAETLLYGIQGSARVHNEAVRANYLSSNQKRRFKLYVMDEALITSLSEPTEEQIEAYYKQYPVQFSEPEYRTLSYVQFSASDMPGEAEITPDQLQAAYDERIDEFRFGEQRNVEQLLYSGEEEAQKARAMAQEGKSFAAIAKATSIINKGGVSLGKIGKDGLLDSAADKVFALEKGGITQPVQSPFGWHLFTVTEIHAAGVRSLDEVKNRLEKDLRQMQQDERLGNMANDLDDAIGGGSTLSEAAKELGLTLHSLPPVDSNGLSPHNVKVQIPDLESFLQTAFELDEQTESTMRLADNGNYFIVRADKITQARVKPLEDVKPNVIANWKAAQRKEKLAALAKEMGEKLQDTASRTQEAKRAGLSVANSDAVTRQAPKVGAYALPVAMMAEAFVQGKGSITKPYALDAETFAIAEVTTIEDAKLPKPDSEELAKLKDQMLRAAQQETVAAFLDHLQDKHGVTINQAALTSAQQEN